MKTIRRKQLELLRKDLQRKEITLLVGPRQAGKTTLMKQLEQDLQARKTAKLYLNMDIESDAAYLQSQQTLLNKIRLELGETGYVFIDEIQRKPNAGVYFKGLYDMDLPYKFVLSGSGSIELKEKIGESLAGRKLIVPVDTISFEEFLDYRTDYKYTGRLNLFLSLEKEKGNFLLQEYLAYGGYPAVVTASTVEDKIRIMDEIYSAYMMRDISSLLGMQQPEYYSRMLRLLAAGAGGLVNISRLASDTGLSVPTVHKYLWYAENTFILKAVRPYSGNRMKEIVKAPVYYFTDLGFRNYMLGSFQYNSGMRDGFVFQNFIFRILNKALRNSAATLHYWRTTDGAEVDFVIDRTQEVIPVEVKYADLKTSTLSRSFRNFVEKYKPRKAFVVNLSYNGELKLGDTFVHFVPYYLLEEMLG
ncbi:MAG: ATP-binding protein [Odoribacter sp.]|nr:ATP-binding protein [Odoribacter sp.]